MNNDTCAKHVARRPLAEITSDEKSHIIFDKCRIKTSKQFLKNKRKKEKEMETNQIKKVMEKLRKEKYKKLTVNAKYLYLQLLLEAETNNEIELTNEKVRKLLSVSNKTAVKIIKELEETRLLTKFKQNKNTNYIKLSDINKNKKIIKLIKYKTNLYINKNKRRYNYDWLKTSYERFGM